MSYINLIDLLPMAAVVIGTLYFIISRRNRRVNPR